MTEPAVIVVGGGPVGLSSAILLSSAGVPTLLAERRPTTCVHPKATVLNTRTMELFRLWGIEDEIRDRGLPVEHSSVVSWMTQLTGFKIGHLELVPDGDKLDEMLSQSPTLPAICPQDVIEPVMLEHLREHDSADVRFDTEVVDFAQDDGGVTVALRDADGRVESIRSQYLIAADGALSRVRQGLGIAVEASATLGRLVNIYFHADLTPHVEHSPSVLYWIVQPRVQGVVHALDGSQRWLLNVFLKDGDSDDHSVERCLARVREAVGVPDLDVEVKSIKPWTMAALVAERFRDRRVFLAGDSAHQFPPTGGFGLNTGVQDAHNLAWKLEAVLRGFAGEPLLDSYELERRPVVELNVEQTVVNARNIMEMLFHEPSYMSDLGASGERGAEARADLASAIPDQREHFDFQGEALGAIYGSPAVVPDGTDPPQVENPITDYVPSAHPGARAPHAWIERDGEELSTIDLFERRFVLLVGPRGDGWREAADAVARSLEVPLLAVRSGADVQPLESHEALLELYGIEPSGAVLVRPDGHVAWRQRGSVENPAGALRSALVRVLGKPLARNASPAKSDRERRDGDDRRAAFVGSFHPADRPD